MTKYKRSGTNIAAALLGLLLYAVPAFSQKVYFIDGFHGGVYGHYPKQYTRYINETLDKNPDWKINLEIEPETWDSVQVNEPANYNLFKNYFADQSFNGRLEYVNPAYGQGYLYNINGESIIRQFYYGIKKLKTHFPNAIFTTYSSEEPCFTSALPQILTSFGFSYASLKNPNTCWGGYTRAHGGELLNWVGPDGTKLLTVPRYKIEALDSTSTWQTIASTNTANYLQAAFKAGIANPVGMCLQDAGWKNGPWLGKKPTKYPTIYKTWRDYIKNVTTQKQLPDWKFSQEDVQVSLVWGAQVLQKIAQQIRVSENKLIAAEKLAVMAKVYKNTILPQADFDEAWRGLLLAQHHDCWIVPYNGRKGFTWADNVNTWTTATNRIADQSISQSMQVLSPEISTKGNYFIRVFNTLGYSRNEMVKAILPANIDPSNITVTDNKGNEIQSQVINTVYEKQLIFKASVASLGYSNYRLKIKEPVFKHSNHILLLKSGNYQIESDLYRIIIAPAEGGIVKSLVAKKLNNKEFVDVGNARKFNELRGYFYKDSSFFSSTQTPATISIIEDGSQCSKILIKGLINQQSFTQTLTVMQNEPVIDLKVSIDWKANPGIGDPYKQAGGYRQEDYRKAFYNDADKLQTLFPLNLNSQQVYKDAPFDVATSKLDNTFFNTWDSIKNNIVLNWVDVVDGTGEYGMALFTDHTTSYAHGNGFPLGLTTQYSGVGLWGRDYGISGPTIINYAIMPHEGRWDKADNWNRNIAWNNPMLTTVFQSTSANKNEEKSLLGFSGKGFEITAILVEGNDLLLRLFNAADKKNSQQVSFDGIAESVDLVELDGRLKQHLSATTKLDKTIVNMSMPAFGIRTVRLKNFKVIGL
jgi:alpha-mannosidase